MRLPKLAVRCCGVCQPVPQGQGARWDGSGTSDKHAGRSGWGLSVSRQAAAALLAIGGSMHGGRRGRRFAEA